MGTILWCDFDIIRKEINKMRKTFRFLAVSLMAAVLMTGCGDAGVAETTSPEVTTSEAATSEGNVVTSGVSGETTASEITEETTEFTIRDYSNYVTLGQYKGISVSPITVTEEEIDARIQDYFHDTVQEGDTVNIDYTGYLDGEPFEGGSAEGDTLDIGSGRFIDGFESGLVGVKVGETVDLNLTFPENYSPDMAGKAVVFTVTVNEISNTIAPEYTLDNVTSNTPCQSLDEYRATIYDEIYSEHREKRMSDIWYQVIENATISGYPQDEVDVYADEMSSYYRQMAQGYGVDFTTFLSVNNYTEETFEAECQEYGKSVMDETMVLHSLANAENITITDEEYETEINKIVEQTKMPKEQIVQYYGGEEYIRQSLLFTKMIEFLEAEVVEQ